MLAVGRGLNGILNLSAMTLIVRSLGVETFGMLVLIHAAVSAVSDIAKFQSWQAVLRYGAPALEADRETDFRRLIKLTVLLDLSTALLGAAVTVIAVPFLAPHFNWAPELVSAIQMYTVSILFMVTATPTGLLRLFDRFDLLSVSKAVGSFVRLVGGVWFTFAGGTLEELLLVWFGSTAASGLWLIFHSIRGLSDRGLLGGPRLGFRQLTSGHDGIVKFMLTTQANTTLSAITKRLGVVIVGFLLSPAAVGLYHIAGQVTTLLSRFAKLMKPAIYPEFARLSSQGDIKAIRQLILRSMVLMAGAGALFVVALVLSGRFLLEITFGHELVAAYGLVVWMASAAAIRMLSFAFEPALISAGYAGVALRIRVMTVSVFVISLFVVIAQIGLDGAGVAGFAAAAVSFAGQGLAVSEWLKRRSGGKPEKPLQEGA